MADSPETMLKAQRCRLRSCRIYGRAAKLTRCTRPAATRPTDRGLIARRDHRSDGMACHLAPGDAPVRSAARSSASRPGATH